MLLPGTPAAIIGFALAGAGLSSVVPTLFSAAGRTPGMAPSVAIAAVSTTGYFGFLCGPPLIGVASEVMTLRWSMAFVFAAACIAIVLARYVRDNTGQLTSDNSGPIEAADSRTGRDAMPVFEKGHSAQAAA
jgi:hypothetical protein